VIEERNLSGGYGDEWEMVQDSLVFIFQRRGGAEGWVKFLSDI